MTYMLYMRAWREAGWAKCPKRMVATSMGCGTGAMTKQLGMQENHTPSGQSPVASAANARSMPTSRGKECRKGGVWCLDPNGVTCMRQRKPQAQHANQNPDTTMSTQGAKAAKGTGARGKAARGRAAGTAQKGPRKGAEGTAEHNHQTTPKLKLMLLCEPCTRRPTEGPEHLASRIHSSPKC